MKIIYVILLSTIGLMCFGQSNNSASISAEELDKIYVLALNNNIELLLSSGWQYIEMNKYGKRISEMDLVDRYKFLSNSELIDLSIKKKKSVPIFRLTHKIYGVDTVDINFSIITVTGKRKIHFFQGLKFKTGEFALHCGGVGEYVPGMRFILNPSSNEWELKEGLYAQKDD